MTLADFATGGILLVILTGVIALPYLVHFDDQKVERPVAVFRCVLWKTAALTLYTLILNGLFVFFCCSIVAITRQHQEQGMLFYVFVLFAGGLLSRMTIIQTWLHLTYWYHDWRTVLIIDRPAHMVTYTRAGRTVKFALNDFVRFIRYESHGRLEYFSRRTHKKIYSYQVWELRDGTELVVTCLLYTFTEPIALLPPVIGRQVKPRVCWLPGDPLITSPLANLFHL